jgi:hypothetical protein
VGIREMGWDIPLVLSGELGHSRAEVTEVPGLNRRHFDRRSSSPRLSERLRERGRRRRGDISGGRRGRVDVGSGSGRVRPQAARFLRWSSRDIFWRSH